MIDNKTSDTRINCSCIAQARIDAIKGSGLLRFSIILHSAGQKKKKIYDKQESLKPSYREVHFTVCKGTFLRQKQDETNCRSF